MRTQPTGDWQILSVDIKGQTPNSMLQHSPIRATTNQQQLKSSLHHRHEQPRLERPPAGQRELGFSQWPDNNVNPSKWNMLWEVVRSEMLITLL
jgi:hypothetical protein